MKLRELGVGLAIVGTVAGCSSSNQEMPTPTESMEATLGAPLCTGLLGKISLVNADHLEFRVDGIKGSPECEKTPEDPPTSVNVVRTGTLGSGKEPTVGELEVGDTFIAECDLGRPGALLIRFDLTQEKDGEGVVVLTGESPPVEDLLAETGVAICNQEQLDRAFGH